MVDFSIHPASPDGNKTPQDDGGDGRHTRYTCNFSFFPYILTTSYRAKNMPTWVCFLFSAAIYPTTSLTPFYSATPNHHTSPPTQPLSSCGHQKCVYMDAFLVSSGFPQLK